MSSATIVRRLAFSLGLVILGVLLGRFTAGYEIRIHSRDTTEDFSRFIARVDSGEVGEVTFMAPGEVKYVTRTSHAFETNLPPDTAQWLTKSLLDRGVKIKAAAGAAR